MIRILLIEDTPSKAKKVSDVLDTIPNCSYEIASDLVTARRYLVEEFNLMILDLNLPERFSEIPKSEKGLEFIKEIKRSKRLLTPQNTIGLTEKPELLELFKNDIDDLFLSIITFVNNGSEWSIKLKNKISEVITINEQQNRLVDFDYDVAFVCALRNPEFSEILKLDYQWERKKIPNDPSVYYVGKIKLSSRVLNVVATYQPQMGLVACSVSTLKLITKFRPRYIIMTGILGGIEGEVNLGDIVIADMTFDYGSGKIIKTKDDLEDFEPDFKPQPLDGKLKTNFLELKENKPLFRELIDNWKGNFLTQEIKLHVGPVGSGAAVIANSETLLKTIKHQRKLLAIDMESYAIFYTAANCLEPRPTAISIKAVSDFANHIKNDHFQLFCSQMAAELANYIIKEELSF